MCLPQGLCPCSFLFLDDHMSYHSLCSSHRSFFAVLKTGQVCACLRASALAISSAWNTPSQNIYIAYVLTLFKLLNNCHHLKELLPTFPHQSQAPFSALFFLIMFITTFIYKNILASCLSPCIRISTSQEKALYVFC